MWWFNVLCSCVPLIVVRAVGFDAQVATRCVDAEVAELAGALGGLAFVDI